MISHVTMEALKFVHGGARTEEEAGGLYALAGVHGRKETLDRENVNDTQHLLLAQYFFSL